MDKFDIKQHCEEVYTINLEAVNMEERTVNTVEELIMDYALTCGALTRGNEKAMSPTTYLDEYFDHVEGLPLDMCVKFLEYFGYTLEEIQDWSQGMVFEE